ncbi:endonuclease [Haloferula helveola]|uniref:Endonuclease n=1 Tax=Haloferula helveola TaxID=490095 RepID=A0ABM7RJJ3_9BACT|nr:endonuclease [Haloferula helveola]
MRLSPIFSNAPGFLGAFLLALSATSCEKESKAAGEWSGPVVTADAAPPETSAEPAPVVIGKPEVSIIQEPDSPGSLRFIAYNIENWLTMDRYVDGKRVNSKPKPDSEKEAIVTILARHQPDVVGICEIGTKEDLAELQQLLKEAGVDLPHAHHTGGADDTRRLAMLSRFPFASTQLHESLEYELEGKTMGMGRGILDATVDSPIGPIRFLGAHLKSKREIPEADQEMMRRAEAHLLRDQATSILTADPSARLIVYGDMNDTRQASAIRTIRGPSKGPTKLGMAFMRDSRAETWTHFWEYQDVYSRFDYVFFSMPMTDGVLWDECRIIDDPEWKDASDHRALLFVLE